eukprot:3935143-Rhodomonas_salina.1
MVSASTRGVRCPALSQRTAHGAIRRTSMTAKPRPGFRPARLAKAVCTCPCLILSVMFVLLHPCLARQLLGGCKGILLCGVFFQQQIRHFCCLCLVVV